MDTRVEVLSIACICYIKCYIHHMLRYTMVPILSSDEAFTPICQRQMG